MSNITTYFPPGVECFHPDGSGGWNKDAYVAGNCNVTEDMLVFLNLTEIATYMGAYCLNPASDDSCPFGFCPQPDIAGPLVRIATYITTSCTSILIFYSPKKVKDAFWSQLLTVYSLLLTALISIFRRELTKFHALTVSVIVASPLTIYLVVYSIFAMWSRLHRLEDVLGKGHLFRRLLVLSAAAIWTALTIYSFVPHNALRFAQQSCQPRPLLLNFFLITPISVGLGARHEKPWLGVVIAIPLFLIILAWVTAILLKRDVIWPPGEPYRVKFWEVWLVVGEYFPFIHFVSVVIIPFTYWVACIELGVYNSNENQFTLSFGQVLAVFVAVPPFIQVCKLAPRLIHWFWNLTWLRRIDGNRRRSRHPSADEGQMKLSKPGRGQSRSLSGSEINPILKPMPYDPRPSQDQNRGRYSQLES